MYVYQIKKDMMKEGSHGKLAEFMLKKWLCRMVCSMMNEKQTNERFYDCKKDW